MEGSPYRNIFISLRKGTVPGTGPGMFPSRDPGRLLAETRRPVSCLGSGGIQYMKDVMSDLQEVTIQYRNCPDPIESAARRQRVLQGDARGDMEEASANIITATTAARTAMLPPAVHPSETPIILGTSQEAGPSTQAKRRGQPPLKKKPSPTARKQTGDNSRKMNLALAHASPG
ncbi:hypothetical protein DY000_02020918 [Brassica cretica]|uniref:Uncharacterized protein n=1 Tax=Brassica cretica TaxID=69181 RepID=A0ABQ7E6X4_BRACR|nr:hypothetical protein DY000_02020918 [Brassica cretica]